MLRTLQSHERSDRVLAEAIASFPSVVPLLADKIDIFIPGDIRGHPSFRVHVDARLVYLRRYLHLALKFY